MLIKFGCFNNGETRDRQLDKLGTLWLNPLWKATLDNHVHVDMKSPKKLHSTKFNYQHIVFIEKTFITNLVL